MTLRRVLRGEPRQVYHNDLFELPPDEVVAVEVRDADQSANNRSDGRSERSLQIELRSCCADLNNVKIAPVPYARVCKKQEGKASLARPRLALG